MRNISSNDNTYIPPVVSMTQMARLLNLSRSRFYQLISAGILLPPIYSLNSKRPFYTEEMTRRNLQVRRNNVGINGQIIIFYAGRKNTINTKPPKTTGREKPSKQSPPGRHDDLIDALEGLGVENITAAQVEAAMTKCYPDGTDNIDKDEILRTIFRYIKRRNTRDNVRR